MANTTFNRHITNFLNHLKKNIPVFIGVGIFCVIGVVLGIILLYGEKSYLSLLTTKNQNLLGYISGNSKVFSIFISNLFSSIITIAILFIFCLHYYTSFLSYLYFAYQSAVCTIVCGVLIQYQGFSAVLNTIVLILPANILLFAALAIIFSIFLSRAKLQNKYKYSFSNSFKYNNFNISFGFSLLLLLAVYIIFCLIIPIIIKGIYIFNY